MGPRARDGAVRGFRALRIESDPNDEGFYLARGAVWVGEVESPVEKGRMLPLLRVAVPAG